MVTPFKNKSVAAAMLFLAAVFCLALVGPTPLLAVDTGLDATAGVAGFKTTNNPAAAINISIGNFINQLLGFVGVIFLLLTIYAGFRWMTAQGNDKQIDEAKKLLTGAVIGMIIIFGAYALTTWLIATVGQATGQNIQ
ncbi:MAG: hypothetical protein WCT10_04415 [Patescibacteria group bacterium]|jgi:hypothetical protein